MVPKCDGRARAPFCRNLMAARALFRLRAHLLDGRECSYRYGFDLGVVVPKFTIFDEIQMNTCTRENVRMDTWDYNVF